MRLTPITPTLWFDNYESSKGAKAAACVHDGALITTGRKEVNATVAGGGDVDTKVMVWCGDKRMPVPFTLYPDVVGGVRTQQVSFLRGCQDATGNTCCILILFVSSLALLQTPTASSASNRISDQSVGLLRNSRSKGFAERLTPITPTPADEAYTYHPDTVVPWVWAF